MLNKILRIVLYSIFTMFLFFILTACNKSINIEINKNDGNSIGNLLNYGLFCYDEENLYFNELKDGESVLYRSNYDLSNKEMIKKGIFYYLNITKDQIFYVDENKRVYSMNKEGENEKLLFNDDVTFLYTYKNKLYLLSYNYNNSCMFQLLSMNYDGSGIKVLSDESEEILKFWIYDDKIYSMIAKDREGYKLMESDLDGENNVELYCTKSECFGLLINQNKMYYIRDGGAIEVIEMENGNIKILKNDGILSIEQFININDNFIIFPGDDLNLYAYNINTLETKSIGLKCSDLSFKENGKYGENVGCYLLDDFLYYYKNGFMFMKKIN